MPDADRAALYQKKSSQIKEPDPYSAVFDDLTGVKTAADYSPLERTRAANWQYMHGDQAKAREIVLDVLKDYPDYPKALELLLDLDTGEDQEQRLVLCERLLKINKDDVSALTKKAYYYLMKGEASEDNLKDYQTAYELYKSVYELDYRHPNAIKNLIFLSFKLENTEDTIKYCLAAIEIEKTPLNYHRLANAYYLNGDFQSEIAALYQVRASDQNYENRNISLNILEALFAISETPEQYKKCAKKLNNFLIHYPEEKDSPVFQLMLKTFKENNITVSHIPCAEESKEIPDEKPNSTALDLTVPSEMKSIILSMLSNMHEWSNWMEDKAEKKEEDSIEKGAEWYQIGDKKLRLFGFIPAKAGQTPQERADFEAVLATGVLKGPNTQGISCIKKLHNGKYSIKIKNYDRRMLTNKFFRAPMRDGSSGEATVMRFCPVKNHKKLNK